MNKALDRAYDVAWALRGPVVQRLKLRAPLGWIAVSGEDDKPHRPVNVPAPPYEQHEIDVPVDVAVPGLALPRRLTFRTRFFVASADGEPAPAQPFDRRKLPDDVPLPTIPDDHEVILFLHGHSSGAEEALELIPHLIQFGLERGKKYSVISFDLPNNGYSSSFANTDIATEEATTYPHGPFDNGPIRTPILDFIEDFVVAFVDELSGRVSVENPIKNRISVIGGSLGGNLGLRLGRRRQTHPNSAWIAKAIAAWSPASVWMPMVQNTSRSMAPKFCLAEFKKQDTDSSRGEYFVNVYDKSQTILFIELVKPQPEYWYRAGWNAKYFQILLSRLARREIYDSNYGKWHWRVAGEQLIYSHFNNTEHGVTTDPMWYELNDVRTLLVAGEDDNYPWIGIYDGAKTLGYAMRSQGRLLLIEEAGHSIHAEHPHYLASEIVKFLNARSMEILGVTREEEQIERVIGTNHTDGVPFDLSRQEVIDAINRGDEFFVTGSGGEQILVKVVQGLESGEFLRADADGVPGINLESLPELGGPGTAGLNVLMSSVSRVAVAPLSNGRLELWASEGASLFTTWQWTTRPGRIWAPWVDFVAEVGTLPGGARQAAVVPLSNGALEFWVVTANGGLFSTWKVSANPDADWAPWFDFIAYRGSLPNGVGVQQVAMAPLSNGAVESWVVTANGGLFSTWKVSADPDADWAPWFDFIAYRGSLPNGVGVQQVAMVPLSNGAVESWVVTTNGGLFSTWKVSADPDAEWAPWFDFLAYRGRLPGGVGVQQVAMVPLSNGAVESWVVTTNGGLFSTWKVSADPDAEWAPWFDFLAYRGGLPGGVQQVAMAPMSDGRVAAWAVTTNGRLFSTWKVGTDPSSDWAPWMDFLA
jgi:pimeloyl-ACP methyl ester carboxylesterase